MNDLKMPLLRHGRCEGLKASVHGVVLGAAVACAAYNFAAWMVRRQRHSAINAGLYTLLAVWEGFHVQHHVECHPAWVNRVNRVREHNPAA